MPSLVERLAEPFEALEPDTARQALAELWDFEARELTRLETERDDTFRATGPRGVVTIKVAHPADPPAVIELQSAVLEHLAAADPGIPVQRAVRTRTGDLTAEVAGRRARVLTWLDGELLLDRPWTDALLREAGWMLGRLGRALSGFAHPGSDRAGAWDLVRLPDLLPYASDPGLRAVIERFAEEVAPRLDALPHQVVHNDFHPGNVLVAGDRVTGVLDFGDTARTPRIGDLAIALTYLVPDAPRPWPGVEAFLAGYESVVELLPEERAVLPMLMAARTVARTVINQVMHPGARVEEFSAANARKLARILEE